MYTPDYQKQVGRVEKRLLNTSAKLNAAYMHWKYGCNPYIKEPLIYMALHNDRVVGIRAMFGTCWETEGHEETVILPSSSDAIIVPEHRDHGLFRELTDYTLEDSRARGYSHVLNLSPNASNYIVSVMTMGWSPMGSSELLSFPGVQNASVANDGETTAPRGYAEKLLNAGRAAGRRAWTAMRISQYPRLDRNARVRRGPITVCREPRPEEMANLVKQLGGGGRLRHVRDTTFFSWRYRNPHSRYRFLYWGDTNLEGYLVLQNTVGRRRVNIVDWEGRDLQIRADLLETAMELGKFRSVGIWGTSLSAPAKDMLLQAGFSLAATPADSLNRRFDGQFLLKSLSVKKKTVLGHDPLNLDNWDLRMIYSDSDGE
jgi:hypothetical protein